MGIEALIFDVDGTLAETEELHRRAFNETFAALEVDREWPDTRRGWHWDRKTYRRLLRTTGGKERIAAYLDYDLGVDPAACTARIAELHRAKTARYVELMDGGQIELRPGIRDLLDEARAEGVRLAIATTTSRPNVEALCRACFLADAADVFEVIAAGEEVSRKKPAPDVYLEALRRLSLPASRCLALEDSDNGVNSAVAAGLLVVATRSIYTADDRCEGAVAVAGDLVELANLHGTSSPSGGIIAALTRLCSTDNYDGNVPGGSRRPERIR